MQGKAQIDQVLRQKSEAKEIPGVVAIAANSKEVIYQGAFGKRDLSKDDAMTLDSVFWIASMTKAITAAAAMQLVEQGKLSLEAPIDKVLPDLATPQVLEGFDTNGDPKLRPAKNPITLRHLMTHTAGQRGVLRKLAYVSRYLMVVGEVVGVRFLTVEVPLRREDTPPADALEALSQPADSGKQVNESEPARCIRDAVRGCFLKKLSGGAGWLARSRLVSVPRRTGDLY
jgi:CubicO group peptidase (beta-lactamase class C family)